MLGFTDATHFLPGFRTRFGLTPSEARQERPSRSPTSELRALFLIRKKGVKPDELAKIR